MSPFDTTTCELKLAFTIKQRRQPNKQYHITIKETSLITKIGHESDIYQLEDYTTLEREYEKFLEPLLAIDGQIKIIIKTDSEQIKELQSIIKSQQDTIAFLTKKMHT